jgi:hypothetical protein
MNTSTVFNDFLANLIIQNKSEISNRYEYITRALNKWAYDHESTTENSLQVGSYGRKTAINGVSDLDMLFILPNALFSRYDSHSNNGQSALLQDVRKAIKSTYPSTEIRADGQVVVVSFQNYVIEVCPGFLQTGGNFKYPDANGGGSWKYTDPKPEIKETHDFDQKTNGNFKKLAKMARAWKNKCGVKIGGLLLDTLCYEFLKKNTEFHTATPQSFDLMIKAFFDFLKSYSKDRAYWHAIGSNQKVYKKKSNFIAKAKTAYNNVIEAIEKKENNTVYSIWRRVFGSPFPYPKAILENSANFTPQEQFIEDLFPLDIKNSLSIECEVTQDGFRVEMLRKMIDKLKIHKKLKFFVEKTDVSHPYKVYWKVKNKGALAKTKDNFRGQIVVDEGKEIKKENSSFGGEHYVECYIVKDNICVARDRINVPISHF